MPEKYMNSKEAADYLGIKRAWLEQSRHRGDGTGPEYVKLERTVRYRQSDLDAFMASRLHSPNKPTGRARAQP